GELRRHPGDRLQELEMPDEDRLRAGDLTGHRKRGRRTVGLLARCRGVGQRDSARAKYDIGEFEQEVAVPALAPELTVGDDVEADVLLQLHGAADFRILDGAQL